MILWVKAFHIIAMVAWFAGLFYLPRLFVYHAISDDSISIERFKVMERRLYKGIMIPAAVLTTALGIYIVTLAPEYYLHQKWFHWKMLMVAFLWVYHGFCGYYLKCFAQDKNKKSSGFFRLFNELPTVLLIAIVILVVVKC